MKKNSGFTLVELIAVIVILSLLIAIIVPNVLKNYGDSTKKLYNIMVENICRASNLYMEEYESGLIIENTNICEKNSTATICEINIQKLIDKKYLDEGLKNPITNEPIESSEVQIIATYNSADSTQIDANGVPIYTYKVFIDNKENTCNK